MKAIEGSYTKDSAAQRFCAGYVKALKKGKGSTYKTEAGITAVSSA
jgi:hypothetical protein